MHRPPSPPPFDPDEEDDFNAGPLPPQPPVRQSVPAPVRQPAPAPVRQAAPVPVRQAAPAPAWLAAPPERQPPPRPPPPRHAPTSSMDDEIRCNCNAPAVQRTVTKESESKGKKFWTCETRGCSFFKWVEDPAPVASGSRSIPAKRSYSGLQDSGVEEGGPGRRCKCDLTAVQRTVVKDGPNKGRKFWKCPNVQGAECGMFEWDDEPPRTNNGAGAGGSFGAGNQPGGSRDQDVCYKCNGSGHWANACPNGEGSANKRARSFGSKADNRSPVGACYKCNEEGHYSADCPTTGGTRSKAKSGPALSCFKCGEEGHFSNACPSDGGSAQKRSSSTRGTTKRGKSQGSASRGSGSKRGRGKKRTFGVPS
ncbi:hypothetical protein B0H13DRAFT_1718273 [Mycena leptocephala]|nr:hypothetical protein B0H13DRAFT_1718273 [Mycena leptocephala]